MGEEIRWSKRLGLWAREKQAQKGLLVIVVGDMLSICPSRRSSLRSSPPLTSGLTSLVLVTVPVMEHM